MHRLHPTRLQGRIPRPRASTHDHLAHHSRGRGHHDEIIYHSAEVGTRPPCTPRAVTILHLCMMRSLEQPAWAHHRECQPVSRGRPQSTRLAQARPASAAVGASPRPRPRRRPWGRRSYGRVLGHGLLVLGLLLGLQALPLCPPPSSAPWDDQYTDRGVAVFAPRKRRVEVEGSHWSAHSVKRSRRRFPGPAIVAMMVAPRDLGGQDEAALRA